MKYTIVIAALLGAITAVQDDTTNVWELRSVNDHKTDSTLQGDFGTHATNQANARPPLRSHVQEESESSDSDESESSDSSDSDK